jgi:hypothetical protein
MTTNHSGWHVEIYSIFDGWRSISPPLETEAQAEKLRVFLKNTLKNDEFRVYEVLV